MAKRYPPIVSEAIWAMMCEGVPVRVIAQKLHDGEGCPPTDMPRRTLNDHIRRLKRQRGVPSPTVEPGQEVEVAEAIVRRSLEALARTEALLTQTSKERPLMSQEVTALDRCARAAIEIKRREAEPKAPREPRETPAESDFLTALAGRSSV